MAAELPEINIAGVIDALQEILHRAFMRLVGRAHEAVVGNGQLRPEFLKTGADRIHEFLGSAAFFFGGLHDFVPMLVRACQKQRVVPEQFVKAREGVGHHGGIGVTQVRFGVDVINGRGDEKAFHARLRNADRLT